MNDTTNILIVEDSPTQAMHLKLLLQNVGYTVSLARDGEDGLDAVLKRPPDLIISDVVMPKMNGYEMCRAIKDNPELGHIPLILLTTLSDPEDIIRGLDAKADYYVTKPFDEESLLTRVEDILAHPPKVQEDERMEALEIVLRGKRRKVVSSSQRIMNLLLSTYENAVQQNAELLNAQEELRRLNAALEERIYELRVSENRFRVLVKTIPDIVYRIDPQGRFTFINEAIERLGYVPEDLIGEHFSKIILPSDATGVGRELVLEAYRGKVTGAKNAPKLFDERRTGERKTTGLEIRLIPRHEAEEEPGFIEPLTQEYVIVEVNSSGMWEINPDADEKELLGTVGVIRDISVRKQMEKELEESERRLRTIFDYASAGILLVEPESKEIVDVNPMAVKMIGASKKAIIGSVCHRFMCPAENGKCPMTDLGEDMDSSERILITRMGEEVPILKTVARVSLKGKPHLLESFVDISQLKATQMELKAAHDHLERRVEERTVELKESQAQLIQAEKLGALGTLTAGIAHELNNPMMGILNFAQYCRKHVAEDSKIHTILGDMERETRRCIDIVRNLQTFSRMEAMDHDAFEAISCGELIERVHKLLSYRFEKEDVSFNTAIAEDCPKVFVNPSNMQQVFLNLISNALDAVKEGETRAIQVRAQGDGKSGVRVQVTDTGPGIPAESRERIFDPFYTTKPVGKGTGLGLSVSQSIVESHNGEIECDSTEGGGTTFTVWLPVRQDQK